MSPDSSVIEVNELFVQMRRGGVARSRHLCVR